MTCAFFFLGPDPCSTCCVMDSPLMRHLSCLHVHLKHASHSPGGHKHITLALMHTSQEQPMSVSSSCSRCQLSTYYNMCDPHTFHFNKPTTTFMGITVACKYYQPQAMKKKRRELTPSFICTFCGDCDTSCSICNLSAANLALSAWRTTQRCTSATTALASSFPSPSHPPHVAPPRASPEWPACPVSCLQVLQAYGWPP